VVEFPKSSIIARTPHLNWDRVEYLHGYVTIEQGRNKSKFFAEIQRCCLEQSLEDADDDGRLTSDVVC
jgi:hypothetical protein